MPDQPDDSPTDPISEPDNLLRNPRIQKAVGLTAIAIAAGSLVIALGIPWIVVGVGLVLFGVLLTIS